MIVELAVGIAANLPLESRDVFVEYVAPGVLVQEAWMKVESWFTGFDKSQAKDLLTATAGASFRSRPRKPDPSKVVIRAPVTGMVTKRLPRKRRCSSKRSNSNSNSKWRFKERRRVCSLVS